jgi:stage II sporulation protein D
VNRALFLASIAAACACSRGTASAQESDADPALSAPAPELRVLLGRGDAQIIDAQTFSYDGRRYRGTFAHTASGVVSLVSLEQYLYSVVAREMSAGWPAAALQAQAICSRTYALQRSSPRHDYDVDSSESSQVYGGLDAEAPACTAAVDATGGNVLLYAGSFASIAYSSSCGGHTESAADAWGGAGAPYLLGVPCPWCTASPDYHWTASVPAEAVSRAFAPASPGFGRAAQLSVASVDASGRARAFTATDDGGISATLDGSTLRGRLGSRVLRSLLVRGIAPAADSNAFVVQGSGLGHGVGLCQWGAKGMALAGNSAPQIVAFYFPGTQIGHD